jgi:hypothetical protein
MAMDVASLMVQEVAQVGTVVTLSLEHGTTITMAEEVIAVRLANLIDSTLIINLSGFLNTQTKTSYAFTRNFYCYFFSDITFTFAKYSHKICWQ